MKKITFIVALFISVASFAQITLTQSVDPTTVDDGGVACWSSTSGEYRLNSFYRAYDLSDFGVTGNFEVSSVEYGQGSADDGKVITLNIYTVDNINLALATFTLIATETHTSSSADDLSLISVPMTATIPAGSIVAFEVSAGDSGANTGETYFPGLNAAGENGPSYLQSADCSVAVPTPVGGVTGVDEFYVMNVIGENVELGINDLTLSQISVYPNPTSDVLNLKVPSSVEVSNVAMFDVLGKQVSVSYNNGVINTANLSQGIYMLKVETNAGTLTQKVVKQ
ncbi:T9SS type A sorting domain-containing protein [Aequorivita echinoideorum]|uniref:T9SS type A sorting domain-containing protein n=1 Tax=Aequorivita echinoideorum TaxID=1549647 RepID=A0ABS5S779_9FLAO|nr:T9SS type A sorting domain-containing protein [Aequorivita echinoideorum]MBT0609068.1 T9SS type A sorting domain-containing protein [Aequorivita echinoideorum]